MKWIAYSLAISLFASGALVASSTASAAPSQTQETTAPEGPEVKDEDFIPTEKVPADSAISFPVDI